MSDRSRQPKHTKKHGAGVGGQFAPKPAPDMQPGGVTFDDDPRPAHMQHPLHQPMTDDQIAELDELVSAGSAGPVAYVDVMRIVDKHLGRVFTDDQVAELAELVSSGSDRPVACMEVLDILNQAMMQQSHHHPPPRNDEPWPRTPTDEEHRANLQHVLAMHSHYGPTEFEKELMSMSPEQMAEVLRTDTDTAQYIVDEVQYWVRDNAGPSAERLEADRYTIDAAPVYIPASGFPSTDSDGGPVVDGTGREHRSEVARFEHEQRLLGWGYDDPYFGPMIRALTSLKSENPRCPRPSKEQALTACTDNADLRTRCLEILNGGSVEFNLLEHHRVADDIGSTEAVRSIKADLAGTPEPTPAGYRGWSDGGILDFK